MTSGQDKYALPDLAAFLGVPRRAVLAPASGGCAQYLFSADVEVTPLPGGGIGVCTPARADAQQRVLQETTLSLRIPLEVEPDGTERTQLVLTGRLDPVGAASARVVRFLVERAHLADISGRVTSVNPAELGL
ncbi:MAG TPA: hypothetical protein PKE12_15075 [Kiritimatiellia bacterium]|nr:hypothetical protein [Kiritimatiellia bacterium]